MLLWEIVSSLVIFRPRLEGVYKPAHHSLVQGADVSSISQSVKLSAKVRNQEKKKLQYDLINDDVSKIMIMNHGKN